jgi:hypothetical protein
MLVMHVNPQSLNETHTKKVERIQTRGGFVEQHWGDELSEISADGSTGAFVNVYTGLSSVLRQQTIAWDRYQDLYDLFHHNGSVYDPYGNIVLQGNVMLLYDRGTYIGYFRSFDVEETADAPFVFKVNWSFKVQEIILKIPGITRDPSTIAAPAFQAQNLQGSNITATAMGAVETNTGSVEYPSVSDINQVLAIAGTDAVSDEEALKNQARMAQVVKEEAAAEAEAEAQRVAEEKAAAEAAAEAAALQRKRRQGK